MKVSEAIEKLKIGDTVWVKGEVLEKDRTGSPLQIEFVGFTKWITLFEEISLSEPQVEKVEVPGFVGNWYESNKHKLERAIIDVACSMEKGEFPFNLPFEDWFIYPGNHPIETLIKMKLNGYTVKPKRWVVKFVMIDAVRYFSKFNGCNDLDYNYVGRKENAHIFTDKSKAEAVAVLVKGTVEEVAE